VQAALRDCPGFLGHRVLYEPLNIDGKIPAILNTSGHDVADKAFEYQQKRCINQAFRGILALSLE
jgi:hypothetical protein